LNCLLELKKTAGRIARPAFFIGLRTDKRTVTAFETHIELKKLH
jgi:hypothetical protein